MECSVPRGSRLSSFPRDKYPTGLEYRSRKFREVSRLPSLRTCKGYEVGRMVNLPHG